MKMKPKNYFKYAIGEIVLVVIGILIALSINNWNQNGIRENNETTLVQQLLVDAKADSIFYNDRYYKLTTQIKFYNKLVEQCSTGEVDSTFILSPGDPQPFIMLASQSNVIKNNSNAFDNILNDDLKIAIQKYIAQYEYFQAIKSYNNKIDEYLVPLRVKYHEKMPEVFEVKSADQLSFLCQNETDLGVIKLLKSYAIDASRHTDKFLLLNYDFIKSLQNYLDMNSN